MYNVHSIKFLYDWFLKGVAGGSLNSFYYLFTYTKLNLRNIMQTTAKIALSCIPDTLKTLPIFIVIDDTLQEKFGVHFECYGKLFDHVARNGSKYLNGHCFVGLALRIPVYVKEDEICYLTISIGYRLKKDNPDKSKLQIASEMIEWVMKVLKNYKMVVLLCDSWYPKKEVLETVNKYKNLELSASVRVDTVLHDLPPKPTGKRGRPNKKGNRLDIHNQKHFLFTEIGEYFIASRKVLTNLFKDKVVYATATTADLSKDKSYRLFLSTLMPEQLDSIIPALETKLTEQVPENLLPQLLPYMTYRFRWMVEVVFYEQKTFWSFGNYMLRSALGIENYVNILNICYSAMKLLPRLYENFSPYKMESPQTVKYILSRCIHREIILSGFESETETAKKSKLPIMPLFQRFFKKKCL
jgi:hypothetical protein